MNETNQKAWRCSIWKLVASIYRFSQVQSVCGTLATRVKTSSRYAGKPRSECNQERRYINSSKVNGRQGVDRKKQPKRRNERAGMSWPYRKDKTRKPLRLQPFRNHTLPIELRHEQAGRVIGDLQENRLHGAEYQPGSSANGKQSSQVETDQKKSFRCPVSQRNTLSSLRETTKAILKIFDLFDFVATDYKTPCFGHLYRCATGHLYRLTIYMQFIGAYV